ncbi:hypothetical protein VSR01_01360 [Actinacidiphila sp. DG2A-62]|uniref:hypothetical protein n=1 Tax=Actinacidiphila sp. DG2A-62 TaxID=3108821 RepID=UPI002DBAF30E|nr:hypothetical protein [Actinacidiphila sp. DG2A-62]MEC3992263.1 hypothetical protein [Actinacidiphila sp. DG2A-62]
MAKTADAPTPAQARTDLADAQRERAEAQSLADALAEQIRSGDANVTPGDLAAKRDLIEFADLRVEAARRRLAAAEEADRHARAQQIAQRVQAATAADQTEAMTASVQRVTDAVADLHALVSSRNEQVRDLSHAADAIADELTAQGIDRQTSRSTYGVMGGTGPAGGRSVVHYATGTRMHELEPARAIAGAVALALTPTEITTLYTALRATDGGVGALFNAFPFAADLRDAIGRAA